MIVSFHPKAAVELEEAIDYYEDCQLGLGLQLAQEVEASTQLVKDYPLAWAIVDVSKAHADSPLSIWLALFSQPRRDFYSCSDAFES